MAAIVRVKRRLDDDPANSLLLSCKRLKFNEQCGAETFLDENEIKSIFKFAGTLPSKQTNVTRKVREAIRKEKIQREYRTHDVTAISRTTHATQAGKNRFKIVASRRSMDFDSLDKKIQSCESKLSSDLENCENKPCGESTKTAMTYETSLEKKVTSHGASCDQEVDEINQTASRMFCLYDIEEDPNESQNEAQCTPLMPSPVETITCNGVAMVRHKIQPCPRSDPNQYVYDIYYMNNTDFDFRSLENILSIEAVHEDMRSEEARERIGVNGEDEDSNDEDNWRNDYPDEGEKMGGGMLDFGHEDASSEESSDDDYNADDGMSHMMNHRLKICDSGDSLSDDEYFDPSKPADLWNTTSSYSDYKQRVIAELKQDYGEDSS